ncbi:hypothetical protein Dimus_004135 [Dionaea muscipula]
MASILSPPLPPPSTISYEDGSYTVAIAIDKDDKNSQHAVKWAVDNLLKAKTPVVLIHVRTQSSQSQDAEPVSKNGRPPTETELQQLFLPYRGFCARKGVDAKEVVLHDLDVASALIEYISNNIIGTIVVGASNRNALTRKFKAPDVATSLAKSAPDFCSIYVIAKGKVQSMRSANRPLPTPVTSSSAASTPRSVVSTPNSSYTTPRSNVSNPGSGSSPTPRVNALLAQTHPHPSSSTESEDMFRSRDSWRSEDPRLSVESYSEEMYTPSSGLFSGNNASPSIFVKSPLLRPRPPQSSYARSDNSSNPSFGSTGMSSSERSSYYARTGSSLSSESSSSTTYSQDIAEAEMTRLKLELKKTMELYQTLSQEAEAAKHKADDLQARNKEENTFETAQLAKEAALAVADLEKLKCKTAMDAAQMSERLVDMEKQKTKVAELKAKHEEEERKKATEALAHNQIQYRRYTSEEIEIATDYFSASLKIGEGGYGSVYRATLNHTPVAIKVLRSNVSQGIKQFQKEIEVLSRMRHPNMVLLLGACPVYGCLVYEYMENGTLEDRLFCKNNSQPLSWRIRFKIAAEIATALLFLHNARPEPVVHRDLKPANILLDRNYVSKISDVGLARLVPPSIANNITQYYMTTAAGTFCYIDPEYQQTGILSVESDVYSFGVMLLQIITVRPAMGLTHAVEYAIEKGNFSEVLDPAINDWPIKDTLSFAKMALQCCELRKRDRPDLGSVVLPELIRLRDLGYEDGSHRGI